MSINPTVVRYELIAEIRTMIREEMTWFPAIVAHDSDVIDVTRDLIPDPEGFDTAEEFLDASESDLDVMGYMLRESIEGLFTGIVYTHESIEFWREYESECEEAASEYGLMHEASEHDTVSDFIVRVADYGGMFMLSDKASDICYLVDGILERFKDEYI